MISAISRLEGFGEERTQEIALVATELINNAIENAEPTDMTEIRGGAYADHLDLLVTDRSSTCLEADCFEFDGPPDAASERGRGLFLIKSFSDDVRVSVAPGGGNRITVRWSKSGGENDEG